MNKHKKILLFIVILCVLLGLYLIYRLFITPTFELIENKYNVILEKNKIHYNLYKNMTPEPLNLGIEEYKREPVPKKLYRTWCSIKKNECGGRSLDINVLNSTLRYLPDWEQIIYQDIDIDNFLEKEFGKNHKITKAYNLINPKYGAAKADLFRYLIIYKYGGLYLDMKSSVSGPIPEMPEDKDIWISHWNQSKYQQHLFERGEYQNWYIYARKGCPLLKEIIERVVHNIYLLHKNPNTKINISDVRSKKGDVLCTTGPISMTFSILNSNKTNIINYDNSINDVLAYDIKEVKLGKDHYSKQTESLIFPAKDINYIPKVVYMTYHDIESIPEYVFNNIHNYCSGYEVRIYNDQKCRDFLYNYYGPRAVSIFDNLSVGAHKADFWRYCIIYLFGGYYFDIKVDFKKHIDDIFNSKENKTWYSVMCYKGVKDCIFNGIIVSPAYNPVLWKCILYFFNNFFNTPKYHTFTLNLYKNLQYTCSETLKIGKNHQNKGWTCILFDEKCIDCVSKDNCDQYGLICQIYNEKDINIIQTRYTDFPWKSNLKSTNKIKFINFDNNHNIIEKESNKIQIAIVTTLEYHLECLGVLLDTMNDQYDIDLYTVSDIHGYIEYFQKRYTFKVFNINSTNIDQTKYIRIIKLTSHDPYKINDPNKLIHIYHHNVNKKVDKPLRTITLSKLTKCNINCYTVDSIFKADVDLKRNNQILLIGFWEDGPLYSLINKFNYSIINIRGGPRPIDKHFCKYSNIQCIYKPNTEKLFELVSKSKFIFIQPKKDRFSGAIALALSFNIPMIMDQYQSTYYDFPCFTYKNNIDELQYKLNNLSDTDYNNFMNVYTNYIKNTRESNRKNANKILQL